MFGNWDYDPATKVNVIDVPLHGLRDVSGKEIDPNNIKDIRMWLENNLIGGLVKINSDGSIVSFTRRGIRASLKREARFVAMRILCQKN
jgi:hypothetical protein